jgi:luciferase family oxidoreductase group 1
MSPRVGTNMSSTSSIPISVLDLVPVASGTTPGDAFRNTLDLARRADAWGFTRYWLAEHHNMPGIASSTPEIVISQVARETSTLRVGSGGVMLPNHAPLKVAEAFQTLEALFPGRIDLGIGRAPGTDPRTAMALRRAGDPLKADLLPEMLDELFAYTPNGQTSRPISIAAYPNAPLPPIYLLGSSDFSAKIAAERGLGFAFAYHINPEPAVTSMYAYREGFTPAEGGIDQAHSILTLSVICAETAEEAEHLAASTDLVMLLLPRGRRITIPPPEEALAYPYTIYDRDEIARNRQRVVIGDPAQVWSKILDLVERTRADELMITTIVHDHAARIRSYELLAKAAGLI